MDRIKLWPHLAIAAVVAALIGFAGVAFYLKHEQTVEAEALPNAARIQRVDGEVAFSNGLANNNGGADADWVAATPNQPFSVGDRIYTRDNAHTSLAFSGRNFARLNPNTSLDVVSLDDRRTQLALRDGSAMFDVGYLEPNQLFEVATPRGAVDFNQPGLYNVGFDRNGGVLVSVLRGLASVVGSGGSGQINKGEMLTLVGQVASQLVLSRLNGQNAGYQVDDYYRNQYPNSYDGRYSNYDAYLNDPNYYDPYQRNVSYQYASSNIPGLNDLDYYGDWQNLDGYGYAWRPRADSGWVPYQQGAWTNDYPYGPTWVSSEPWGYAPYHYGRWANVGNQWYWIPDGRNTTPTYAPALVAFVPLNDTNQIGWVPLGPGDSYAPRFYDDNWQPRYLTRTNVVPAQLINMGIPGAVTVVTVDQFGRPIDSRNLRRVDPRVWANVRPTLDPLTLTPLRNAVIHSAWGRGKIDLPPGIAKKLRETPVFVGADPRESRFRKDLAKSMRVERVSDRDRNEKLKIRDERQEARQADNERNPEQRAEVKHVEQQARQVEQQQRQQDKSQRKAAQQPQGERVNQPARPQAAPRAEYPQAPPVGKHEMKPVRQEPRVQPQGQPAHKQEVFLGPPQPAGQTQGHDRHERQDQGGGKGKGKKP